MLDVRPTAYIVPVAEQVLDDITPVIRVQNFADEDARISGLIRIYRQSTDQLLYSSELAITLIPHGTAVNVAALSAWSPPAPADDDYFILAETLATGIAPDPPMRSLLGAFRFDIKPGPMGPAPAGHHITHELGGMDELDASGLTPFSLYQALASKGQPLGYADLNAAALVPTTELGTGSPNGNKYLRDDQTWNIPPGGGGGTLLPFLLKTTTEMNAIPAPTEGMTIWNTTEHQLYVFDGLVWAGIIMQA